MLEMHFDFLQLDSRIAFYRSFAEQSGAGEYFGANLDALWDALTGEIALPARLWLYHLPPRAERGELAAIIALLEEAACELDGALILQPV